MTVQLANSCQGASVAAVPEEMVTEGHQTVQLWEV